MNKKGLELEVAVKAILALLVLVLLIGILYLFAVKKAGGGIGIIVDDTKDSGDSVLGSLRDLIGGKCDDGKEKCSISGKQMECQDGKWVTLEDECEP
ncbi:MAG: hypothetical protein NDI94_02140 [Candidatus Woesearchaeota archaeon]|nr:hypothetical protein [Candidatus Woesearchaeota archaeon]